MMPERTEQGILTRRQDMMKKIVNPVWNQRDIIGQ